MKLDAVLARVAAKEPAIERDALRRTVLETIVALGFHVATDGEVCDPRPAAVSFPRQQNVRWRGSRGR